MIVFASRPPSGAVPSRHLPRGGASGAGPVEKRRKENANPLHTIMAKKKHSCGTSNFLYNTSERVELQRMFRKFATWQVFLKQNVGQWVMGPLYSWII